MSDIMTAAEVEACKSFYVAQRIDLGTAQDIERLCATVKHAMELLQYTVDCIKDWGTDDDIIKYHLFLATYDGQLTKPNASGSEEPVTNVD